MEKHLVSVCQNLDKKKYKVSVISLKPNGHLQQFIEDEGIEVKTLPRPPIFKKGWLDYICYLFNEFKRMKPDILHIYIGWTHITEVVVGRIAGCTRIFTTRRGKVNEMNGGHLFLLRLTNLFVDKIICNSKYILNWAKSREQFNRKKGILIYNGVQQFENVQSISKNRAPLNQHNVLYIGSLQKEKRHIDFVKAAKIIINERDDINFIIAGVGIERNNIISYINQNNLDNHVILLGFVKDVTNLLCDVDISINLSTTECNSNALLESMAVGVPIIATKIEGNIELINNGENGLLVGPENPKVLAMAISKILNNPKEAKKMGIKGQKLVEDQFSLDKMIAKMEYLYVNN